MTLESTINKNRYIGNGATTQFPFTFKIWKTGQILVYVGDGMTEQEVSAQCTVNITASGGTVTFPTAPATGTIIVLRRNMPYIQEDDYRNGTRFDSEEVEDRFDQDCAERQDLRLDVDRALKVPLTSGKTPEQYEQDFWDAYADSQNLHGEVVSLHADMVAEHGRIAEERSEAIQAVQDEGDHQIQRVQGIASAIMADTGNGCMEMAWTLTGSVAANGTVSISPLWYVVGRHHLQVSVNGVRQYIGRQYEEVGADNAHSQSIKMLVPLNVGDTVDVWISHLHGKDISVIATPDMDGLMGAADRVKLDAMPAVTGLARTTQVLASAIPAGTAITVPAHRVDSGLLLVWHNGVLCEAGAGAQYTDFSTTSIKFNYALPAGDVITAAAVDVSAS